MPNMGFKLPGGFPVDPTNPNNNDSLIFDAGAGKWKAGTAVSVVTIAALIAAGLFTTANIWTSQQTFTKTLNVNGTLNYSNHLQTMMPNSGQICLKNMTSLCGIGDGVGVNSLNFTTNGDFDFNILPRKLATVTLDSTVFNFRLHPAIMQDNTTDTITANHQYSGSTLLLENALKTFATTIVGGAVTANRTLNTPILTQTETIAVTPQTNFTTGHNAGNSTGTTSASPVMLGNYATITPTVTGNIRIYVSGYWDNSVLADGCRSDIRIKTSNMGVNGAALTGTLVGTNFKMISGAASMNQTFSKIVASTGNAAGTKLFIDLSFNRITGGTCIIRNVDWLLQEY